MRTLSNAAELKDVWTWEDIRARLARVRHPYPRSAVLAARAQRADVAPHFLETLRSLAADPTPARDPGYGLLMHAISLLAEFRETRAYRPLVALAHLPADEGEEVFGDFATELLGRSIASVCDGDSGPIRELAESGRAGAWQRAAALDAMVTLVIEGAAEPAETATYFHRLGTQEAERARATPLGKRERIFLTCLADSLGRVGATDALPDITNWYVAGLVDVEMIDLQDVRNQAMRPIDDIRTEALKQGEGYVRDAVEELEHWACFQRDGDSATLDAPGDEPYFRVAPKIGRNEPCPCGSGKKFKKCCGAPA